MNTLKILKESEVAHVELHRPEVGNAFNPDMIREITVVARELAADRNVRAVVLQGAGKHFCSGGDLKWMQESVHYKKRKNIEDALALHEMYMTLYRFPKPWVVRLHGSVFGGGVGLAACADVALADDKTTFCLSETKLGLLPAVVGPFVLRKIGLSRFRALGLSAKPFSAHEAYAFGLVHGVCSEKELPSMVHEWVSTLLKNGPEAMANFKQLVWHMEAKPIPLMKAKTTRAIAKARASKEGQEGLKAFFEKRSPSWQKRP